MESISKRVTLMLVLAALVVAIAVRVSGIQAKSLWGDEIISLTVSMGHSWYPWHGEETEPFYNASHYRARVAVVPTYFSEQLIALLMINDQIPPFYYVLLNLWLHLFGTSEAALRSLSLVASVAAIPLLYLIGRLIASRQVGVYSAWLLAVAPFQVAFGVHNRPYAWLSFFAILSTLAAVHLSRGERGKWFVIYAAAAILGMYTHYLFVWNLVFQVALVFFYQRHNRRFLARFGLVCLTVAAVFCLWVPTFLAQVRWSSEPGHQSWFYWYSGRPSARDVATSLGRNVMLQLAPGRITGTCGEDAGNQCWLDDALTVVFYSVALSIVALCGWRILRHLRDATHGRATPDPWSLCVLWAGCVFVGPAITDLALESHMVSSHRYFISGSGPVYLATAIAIAGTRHRYLRRGVGLATLLFLLGGSGLYLRGLSGSLMYEINARDVARHVDEQSAGPDDLILVLDPGLSPTDFAYYLRSNPDFARVGVPGRRPAAREVPTQLQRITRAKARGRIWYLDDHGPETRANAAVLEWLRTHFVEVEAREFTNVDLFMFTPRRGSTGGTMALLK